MFTANIADVSSDDLARSIYISQQGDDVTLYFDGDELPTFSELIQGEEPVSCTRAQFLDRLIVTGLDVAVEKVLAESLAFAVTPAEVMRAKRMRSWFDNALTFDSGSQLLLAAAAQLGMSPADVRRFIADCMTVQPA